VAVLVPAEWPRVLPLLQNVLGKPVVSDWLTSDPYTVNLRLKAAGTYRSPDRESFLDELSRRWLMHWWEDEHAIYLRDRSWYLAALQEPPLSVLRRFRADLRAGALRRATLDALATLTRPQLLTLVEQTELDDGFQKSEAGLADWLSVYRQGSPAHREEALGRGLPALRMAPAQWRALAALAPDSELRTQAGEGVEAAVLRLTQRKLLPHWDRERRDAYLDVTCSFGASAVSKQFSTPLRDPSPPLVCRRTL
jgi:hypothetical protein